jgi:hypothetical protein
VAPPGGEHGLPARRIILNGGEAPLAPPVLSRKDSTAAGWQIACCIAESRSYQGPCFGLGSAPTRDASVSPKTWPARSVGPESHVPTHHWLSLYVPILPRFQGPECSFVTTRPLIVLRRWAAIWVAIRTTASAPQSWRRSARPGRGAPPPTRTIADHRSSTKYRSHSLALRQGSNTTHQPQPMFRIATVRLP